MGLTLLYHHIKAKNRSHNRRAGTKGEKNGAKELRLSSRRHRSTGACMISSTSVNVLLYFICLRVLPPLLSPSFSASPRENAASAEAPAERGGRRRAPEPPHLRTIPPTSPQLFLIELIRLMGI